MFGFRRIVMRDWYMIRAGRNAYSQVSICSFTIMKKNLLIKYNVDTF